MTDEPSLMQQTTVVTYRRWGWTDDDRVDLMEHVYTQEPDHGPYITVAQVRGGMGMFSSAVNLNLLQLAREGELSGATVSGRLAAEGDRTVAELTAAVHRTIPYIRYIVLG